MASKWKIYDWFKNWQTPNWLRALLRELNDLMFAILKSVSQSYIQYLQTKIIEASQHKDWSNDQKFNFVFLEAKKGFVDFAITLKDSEINMLIEQLVNLLKKYGVIT